MPKTMVLAGCAVTDINGRVLLIHRTTPELTQWEMPGGKVEPGEHPRDAAVREIREELGLGVSVSRDLGQAHFDFHGTPCDYHYFEASITTGEPVVQEAKHDAWAYVDLNSTEYNLSRGALGLKRVNNG